tara:strand:+ start:83 stop:445 length:363 start_codon:yes stop_codon:yes gene_type:complete
MTLDMHISSADFLYQLAVGERGIGISYARLRRISKEIKTQAARIAELEAENTRLRAAFERDELRAAVAAKDEADVLLVLCRDCLLMTSAPGQQSLSSELVAQISNYILGKPVDRAARKGA